MKHPRVFIEYVFVEVDKIIFPTYFIVIDMEEDKDVPIILGRPFLATRRALIDMQKRELRLRVQVEEVTFNVFNALKYLAESDYYFRVDTVEAIVSTQVDHPDPLEASLLREGVNDMEESPQNYVQWMDAFEPNRRKYFEPLRESTSRVVPSVEKPPQLE